MQQPYLMGTTCARAMFDHFAGKTPEKQINVPVLVVTKDNLERLLPELKTHVFGQS
jgi:ribose transport system substrate-binding protein